MAIKLCTEYNIKLGREMGIDKEDSGVLSNFARFFNDKDITYNRQSVEFKDTYDGYDVMEIESESLENFFLEKSLNDYTLEDKQHLESEYSIEFDDLKHLQIALSFPYVERIGWVRLEEMI